METSLLSFGADNLVVIRVPRLRQRCGRYRERIENWIIVVVVVVVVKACFMVQRQVAPSRASRIGRDALTRCGSVFWRCLAAVLEPNCDHIGRHHTYQHTRLLNNA
jgi:hypothetical protein